MYQLLLFKAAKKGPPPASKKTRNRKKKGRRAAPATPAAAAPVATPSLSPEALEEVETGSSQSVAGSNSTARRSFSPLSGSSSQRCSSEEEEEEGDYEEDEYSSESEEEGESGYKPGGYHRVQVGEVYNSRFEVLQKLGWGHFSTVWKCLDRQTGAMVAMKVQKSARHYTEAAKDEIELLECTVHAARTEYETTEQQEAIKVVRLVDSFEHKGPNGVHVCMVFEMMGDNLLTLIKYYNYRGVPMQLVQRLTRDMLEGLAFLHDKCQIIHTDLKPENVLLSHHIPQLPKIRKSQWEAFRATRAAQRQKGVKTSRNGDKAVGDGATSTAGDGAEMSKEDKKRLKNRMKKKRQKQRKQGVAADREASVDGLIGNGKMDSTACPTLTTNDPPAVEKLSNSMSQLAVSTPTDNNGPTDDTFKSNFVGQHSSDDTSGATRAWYHQIEQVGDEEEKDWVHLPPEFAARLMLLLPEGRVAGSRRKEREFTLSVVAKSPQPTAEDANNHDNEKEGEVTETSFVLRYLDHVDDDVIGSIGEQVLGLHEGSPPQKSGGATKTKYRLWRVEFDARYTLAVLDYLERRIEGLRFLNLPASSGLVLPGFFLPKPPSNEDAKTAAKAKAKTPANEDDVLDIAIQGINLQPLAGSVDKKILEVKPLQVRLDRWAARFDKLGNSETFKIMQLDSKICDLGNACWTTKHFTNDIQTRQYRCPEVILGKRYDTFADIWSMACFVFELLTGDLLFDPKSGRNFNRDEDHLAQMIELLGRMPKSFTGSQRGLREFFNRKGDLKRIRNLKFWSLQQVLIEKYHFERRDAECLASFLGPMLRYDPSKRATAEECLAHPWLAHVGDVMEEELADSKANGK